MDRIGVLFRRHGGWPYDEEEEEFIDEYMDRMCSRENQFTTMADREEIGANIEYILEINGFATQGTQDEAVAALRHLTEVWIRISVERARRGIESLIKRGRAPALQTNHGRELSQVEAAAFNFIAADWRRANNVGAEVVPAKKNQEEDGQQEGLPRGSNG